MIYREVNGVPYPWPGGLGKPRRLGARVPVINRARNLDKGEGSVAPNDAEECGRTPALPMD